LLTDAAIVSPDYRPHYPEINPTLRSLAQPVGAGSAMSRLLRILYCSRSCVTGSRADVEMQIRKILATARTGNRQARLTGALTFNENCFAQVLEGAPTDLMPLFARICRDPRHCDVKVLAESQPTRRLFPHWSMAFVDPPHGDGRHPLSHFSFEAALTDGTGPEAEQLLDALRRIVVLGSKMPAG
jgi:hypothetical protein